MKVPRVRFTVRRMMIAVAAAGFGLACHRLQHRRGVSLRRAAIEEFWVSFVAEHGANEKTMNYHRKLRRKYDRAARYPWLPIAPETPKRK